MLPKGRSTFSRGDVCWPSKIHFVLLLLTLAIVVNLPYVTSERNPYEVLGVRQDSSQDEIKQAYRRLAKHLHPDKNSLNGEEAGQNFIELNKAFEVLKDPIKRNRFDQYGSTDDNRHARSWNGAFQYQNRQTREYSTHRTYTFFASQGGQNLRKRSITSKQYYNEFTRESKLRPFLVLFYSDFCGSCQIIESTWTKIMDELAKYNVGAFNIDILQQSKLAHELGVASLPQFACLVDGKLHFYHHSELSLPGLVKFLKDSLPANLVSKLRTEEEQDSFVALGHQQNRLSAVLLNDDIDLKLRFTLLAYELRYHYKFGHISTKTSAHSRFMSRFNLTSTSPSRILIFDERIESPIMNLSSNFNRQDIVQLKRVLNMWPYLQLPRISSQSRFDDLCLYAIPRDGDKVQTRLCVILFASETSMSLHARNKLIGFTKKNGVARDEKVVFAFINPQKQSAFVEALVIETEQTRPRFLKDSVESSVLLIERHPQDSRKALHKWLSVRWDPDRPGEFTRAEEELYEIVSSYKLNSFRLEVKVALTALVDEEGPSLMSRVFWRVISNMTRLFNNFLSTEALTAILMLIVSICLTCMFLYGSPEMSTDSPRHTASMREQRETVNSEIQTENQIDPQGLKIIELKAETYNGMVRQLRPGCRSIILLADSESKDALLESFKKAVWPYRRNKTLLFGYLCLDKNLNWYKALLERVMDEENLKLDKRKCIGTVLSLNGFKKYFRFYHAKHHEGSFYDDDVDDDMETNEDGSFLGFDDVESRRHGSSMRDSVYTVHNLLDKLPIWLDKMFDGLTKRYFIDEWPEELY